MAVGNFFDGGVVGTAAAEELDVVVYGGTSAAVTAAVQVARMGRSVVVVSPDRHLGGLTSGGLGRTDSGNKALIGGIAREFYRRLKAYYDDPAVWRFERKEESPPYRNANDAIWGFEPKVAEAMFETLLEEAGVRVLRGERLDLDGGVTVEGGAIRSFRTENGNVYRGKVFIDATYEGDLMAKAGVSYTVGREANSAYGETLNGVQKARAVKHQFTRPVDPYVVPGDPSSGLLPGVHGDDPGEDGAADRRVQAYCFRLCLTDVPENQSPFPRPEGYDPLRYELLLRYLTPGWRDVFGNHQPMPNRKTDTNNHGAFGSDNIGMSDAYPEAGYRERAAIIEEHERYQKGFLWFLVNDPRVPAEVRKAVGRWGLAKDEFTDNGNWPHQIYVREARRMTGEYVTTEHDCRRRRLVDDPVGMGSYNMDSHNCQRYVTPEGLVRNEGDIQVNPGPGYRISYRSLVPKQGEVSNLIVPVCVSSSHIAFGSIRMEPVFMILGQSAATAAVLAVENGVPVQAVAYAELRKRLLADGQVLGLPEEVAERWKRSAPVDVSGLAGTVVDDEASRRKGAWERSRSVTPFVGSGYRHDGDTGKGERLARFEADLDPGRYEVRFAYTPNANRASNVPVTVVAAEGKKRITVDQRKKPDLPGGFVGLGMFRFEGRGVVEVTTGGTDGHVIIDAVQFIPEADGR